MAYIGKTPTPAPLTSSDITNGIVTGEKLNADVISSQTALATSPADTDEFLISDAGVLKRLDASLIGGGGSDGFHALDMSGTASGDLVFTTEIIDDGGNYNTSNGRYTAPSDGKYLFNSRVYPAAGSVYVEHFFKKNGSNLTGGTDNFGRGYNTEFGIHISLIIDLSASDYINVSVDNNVYNNFCYFNGVKLY